MCALLQRRELGRDYQHVFLAHEHAAGGGWPGAAGAGLVADPETLGRVLVGPDVDPLVQRPKFGVAAERQRRDFCRPSIRSAHFSMTCGVTPGCIV